MIASDILSFWRLNRLTIASDEGFRFGDPGAAVTGVLFCWMPTAEAVTFAAEKNCNLIITHEELNFPPVYSGARLEDDLCGATWFRMAALAKDEITLFRAHSSLDILCILDVFAQTLGFEKPVLTGGDSYHLRTYDLTPMPFNDVCARVKERMNLPYLRVCGDAHKIVSRAGLVWGGVGISANPSTVQELIGLGADVLIAGEAEELPMMAARDAGVCYIETSHAFSENPGLRVAADMFARFFHIPVHFYQNKRPWRLLEAEGTRT